MRGNGFEDIQPSPWLRALRCADMALLRDSQASCILMSVVSRAIPRQFGFGKYGKFAVVKSKG